MHGRRAVNAVGDRRQAAPRGLHGGGYERRPCLGLTESEETCNRAHHRFHHFQALHGVPPCFEFRWAGKNIQIFARKRACVAPQFFLQRGRKLGMSQNSLWLDFYDLLRPCGNVIEQKSDQTLTTFELRRAYWRMFRYVPQ